MKVNNRSIAQIINDWVEAGNRYDTKSYVAFYLEDAVLDDPSVGRKFIGREEIRAYFESYFIGYQTKTELRKIEINDNACYLEVEFTGNFPEGRIGGSFDFIFKNRKICFVKADLMH